MTARPLLEQTEDGLYCARGGFHVDPWRPVERAVITHGHADHARPGSRHYLAAAPGERILRVRLGRDVSLQTLAYGETIRLGQVRVSLHPAGHLLGSAQVRLEAGGEIWVASGDYKLDADPTCAAFEPVPCDVFVTECTFGLPVYRWPSPRALFDAIDGWWAANRAEGRTSVLYTYALGKAQRVLAGIEAEAGPVLAHGAVAVLSDVYREAGIPLPSAPRATAENTRAAKGRALVLAPPSARGTPWLRKFAPVAEAFASGWMSVRGHRRRRGMDRGFPLSDHADWDGLHRAIEATGARRIGVTHGYVDAMSRWLSERDHEVTIYRTRFEGEDAGDAAVEAVDP